MVAYGEGGYSDNGYGVDDIYKYPSIVNSSVNITSSSPEIEKIVAVEAESTATINSPSKTEKEKTVIVERDGKLIQETELIIIINSPEIVETAEIEPESTATINSSVNEKTGKEIKNAVNYTTTINSSVNEKIGKGIENTVNYTANIKSSVSSVKLGRATDSAIATASIPTLSPELIVTLDRSVIEENFGASMDDLQMKKGDTHPPVRAEIFGITDEQFYYSDISVIVKHMGNDEIVVEEEVDERDNITNEVAYYWNTDGSDLPYTGTYNVEFEITHPDDRTETFPPARYLEFEVTEGLN